VDTLAFLKAYTFEKSKVGILYQERNLFSQEHHALFGQPTSSVSMVVDCLPNYYRNYSSDLSLLVGDVNPHWSKKLKMACRITIHGARGLAVGV